MFQNELRLAELVNLEEWHKTQDSFSEVLEITIRSVALDGKLICRTSRPSRLCSEILPKVKTGNQFCGDCISKNHIYQTAIDIKKEANFKCPLGLDVFVVPIMAVGTTAVAYIILGPLILKARKSRSEYAAYAKKFGIKTDELADALIEITVFSYSRMHSIINLVKDTFQHMAQTGYHKRRLGEIAPEVVEMDPLFSRYYEEKILDALLHSCAIALDADSGSVMTVDKGTNILHIKVASKLADDIVNTTNLKVGDGIAGLAAKTAKPIILPKDEKMSGLEGKMKRKYIKSSVIVPFNKGNTREVYGVINLNVVRKDRDFSDRDIAIVKELTNLASIALIPLVQPAPELPK